MDNNLQDVEMHLWNCSYEYLWQGKRHKYRCNLISKTKEEAERLLNNLFHPDIMVVAKIYDIDGIGDETSLAIAQVNAKRIIATHELMKRDTEEQKKFGKLQVEGWYQSQYENLPEIRHCLNRYKEKPA